MGFGSIGDFSCLDLVESPYLSKTIARGQLGIEGSFRRTYLAQSKGCRRASASPLDADPIEHCFGARTAFSYLGTLGLVDLADARGNDSRLCRKGLVPRQNGLALRRHGCIAVHYFRKETIMQLSKESRIVSGILLLAVPSILYGGLTLLSLLTDGRAGLAPGSMEMTDTQYALWRAGHAHAGVLLIFSLILQPLVDQVSFRNSIRWMARLGVPTASIVMPAGFFGLAFVDEFKWLIYTGATFILISMVLTGTGLIRPQAGPSAQ